MMERGLLQETETLLRKSPHRTPLQSLGYKEMQLYLKGALGFEHAVRLLKKRTKMYAKRQFTWFKRESGISWIDITDIMDADKIYEKVINDVDILREILYVKKSYKKQDV